MSAFITFGAMSDPMSKQLEGYGIDAETVASIQRAHDAIVFLRIQGLITDAAATKAEKRVVKWIDDEYRKANP